MSHVRKSNERFKEESGQESIIEPVDCVQDPPNTWFLDYHTLNGTKLSRINFFSVKPSKGDSKDRGVLHNIDEDMNDNRKACIGIKVGKGRKWLLHLRNYAFSKMYTLSENSMLSRR